MIPPGGDATAWLAAPVMLIVVMTVAAVAGRLLTWGVATLVDPRPADARLHRVVEMATVLAAVALWWWEVWLGAQLPADVASADLITLGLRSAAHAILFLFLAAASWIDLRHRVIPDVITVPGALTGLAWNAVLPGTLLPIATFIERSFAPPVAELDVLAVAGGLDTAGLPGWLSGPGGLAVAGLLFAVWWRAGTSPDGDSAGRSSGLPSGRTLIAIAGGAGLVAAWAIGGKYWAGLVTALAGLAVAAGLVWATRTGASWALGREAMGFGDVTLMAVAGAWLGWQACLLACAIAVFIGLFHGLVHLLRHSEAELPFGPSLCLGVSAVVVAWRPLWELAAPQFERPQELALVAGLVIVLTAVTLCGWARLRALAPPR